MAATSAPGAGRQRRHVRVFRPEIKAGLRSCKMSFEHVTQTFTETDILALTDDARLHWQHMSQAVSGERFHMYRGGQKSSHCLLRLLEEVNSLYGDET